MRTIALGLTVFGLAAAASAEDIQKLKRTTKAHKELKVSGHASFGVNTCGSRQLPKIDLNIPPKGGTVCTRQGVARLETTWLGKNQHCIGKTVSGVFVIYVSFAGFIGLDTMQYTVRGEQSRTRTYETEIRVEADEATAPGARSAPSQPQKAGPMPACPALVS